MYLGIFTLVLMYFNFNIIHTPRNPNMDLNIRNLLVTTIASVDFLSPMLFAIKVSFQQSTMNTVQK